ncbi:13915_t:CDS:2, partial [Ambispora leptoticha]
AAIRALETCTNNHLPLEIKTDSQYLIKAYQSWIKKWESNDWKTTSKKKEVENKELFQRLLMLIRSREGKTYVPGHAGIEGNEAADRLANAGAVLDVNTSDDNDIINNIISKESNNEEDEEIARTEEQFNRSLDSSIASIPSPPGITASDQFQTDDIYPQQKISEEYINLLMENNLLSKEQLEILRNSNNQ